MQEKIKKLSESIKERVLEKRLGKSEIQENSYHAEEHEGKWVIKDEAGYIMTTDRFDTKEEAEADIAKHGQPKEQILPVENARVKRVVESLDKVSKILKDRATEKGWLNLSKKEIDKKIKELQKKGWYDEYTLDMTLLYHLKDVGNTFSESKINEGNYDSDNAWLGFCTNIKRYANEHQGDIETAIEAELDDLVYYFDVINIWRDMPGHLGSRISEITDLMRADIEEGALEDVDFISGLEESKMNEISDELVNKVGREREANLMGWKEDEEHYWKEYKKARDNFDKIDKVSPVSRNTREYEQARKDFGYANIMWDNAKTQLSKAYDKNQRFKGLDMSRYARQHSKNENHKARKSMKKSVNEDNNLQQIFDDAFSGGTIPAFETANGVMYLEPQGDKIIIGGATNVGIIPQYEFEYDFSQSFDWNIQGMIEQVYEQEGYPDEEWNENHKARKSSKKKMNEMVIDVILDRQDDDTVWTDDGPVPYSPEAFYRAIVDYGDVAWGITRAMDSGTEADVKKALKQYITDNGYAERIKDYIDSVNWLEETYKGRKSVNEISIEKAKAATETRKQRMVDLGAKYGGEMVRNYRSYHDRRVKPSKLSNEEIRALGDKWHDNERKYLKDKNLLAKKQAKSESLAETLLKEAHSVLTMNENEANELTTWQFTARGFSKAMIEKQSVFGSANVRCIVHENADGKVVGTAVVDYYMTETQVEEAIKKALAENGFRATTITDLVNLY
jgi:hypothetical protein